MGLIISEFVRKLVGFIAGVIPDIYARNVYPLMILPSYP